MYEGKQSQIWSRIKSNEGKTCTSSNGVRFVVDKVQQGSIKLTYRNNHGKEIETTIGYLKQYIEFAAGNEISINTVPPIKKQNGDLAEWVEKKWDFLFPLINS